MPNDTLHSRRMGMLDAQRRLDWAVRAGSSSALLAHDYSHLLRQTPPQPRIG